MKRDDFESLLEYNTWLQEHHGCRINQSAANKDVIVSIVESVSTSGNRKAAGDDWNARLQRFCEAMGLRFDDPQWHTLKMPDDSDFDLDFFGVVYEPIELPARR